MSPPSNPTPSAPASAALPTHVGTDDPVLTPEQRRRVLSAKRLNVTLIVFMLALLVGLSAMMFLGVGQIFDWLTPSMRHDLQWKAERGAVDLAQRTQLGIVVKDRPVVAAAAADYLDDADVVGLVVLDAQGKAIFQHGTRTRERKRLFAESAGHAHDFGSVYAAWASSQIEGMEVGRVAIFVSKGRLQAGAELRQKLLSTASVGCLAAFAMSLLFVSLYIGPILRVTGQAFAHLERTTEAALAASRLKSEFLANMSHEIRTPMNGIVGVVDLLNRTSQTPKQQRYAQTIEASARGLLTIIDDILDFSKLEAGKVVLRTEDFELRQMTQEVAELLAPRAHAKGLELVQRVANDVPYSVRGDMDRLKQVIANLVGNAIKFTEQGHVELHVTVQSRNGEALVLRFAVRDTGVGIVAGDHHKLFGMFSQIDGSLTRKHGGTGLGLAISKRLVDAMGGEIGLQSEPGLGSTFWFTVPAQLGELVPHDDGVHPRSARILVVSGSEAQRDMMCDSIAHWGMTYTVADNCELACQLIVESDPKPFEVAVVDGSFDEANPLHAGLFDLCRAEALPLLRLLSTSQQVKSDEAGLAQVCLTKPVRVSELYNALVSLIDGLPMVDQRRLSRLASREATGEARVTGGRVLVVDDNEVNRLVAVDLLTEFGYPSDVACDGREAVKKVAGGDFVAVLMDCQMPEMDGYEATRCIRALPDARARIPIIALTAHAMPEDERRAREAGCNDYDTKPVEFPRLLEKIAALLGSTGKA